MILDTLMFIPKLKRAIILLAFFTPSLGFCEKNAIPEVGQPYQGGVVGCKEVGLPPLIVMSHDYRLSSIWGYFGQKTGATSKKNGKKNTAQAIKIFGPIGQTAHHVCANYEVDSDGRTPCKRGANCYSKWFLPAKNQLNCLFKNKDIIMGFEREYYWSSTEDGDGPSGYAWDQDFSPYKTEQYAVIKNTYLGVRCVREAS